MCKLQVVFLLEKPFLMTAIFNTWLPFLLACCHQWNFGDTTLTYCSFEENIISLDIEKISASYWKKHITTCNFIRWRSKWRRRLRRPFQNDKDFIDSLCQKFPTLAQGTFDNEALKFSVIEPWNLESSFLESPYFVAFSFCDFRAKQYNRDVITSSKTGIAWFQTVKD